ncbi:hypothetical protein [Citricoccus nitrophenolicus]|uniref:hypothetical protein n=1 Tax=Citricoccus nitrophenolicus TaxID=863575 RepID=UPI0039B4098A
MTANFEVDAEQCRRIVSDVLREAEAYDQHGRTVADLFVEVRWVQNLGPMTRSVIDEVREKCVEGILNMHRDVQEGALGVIRGVEAFNNSELQMVADVQRAGTAGEGSQHA